MNDNEHAADRSCDQRFARQLDRLVDGELSAADRRELLAQCEERADGWRRCALAFLEAQAWRAEFGAIAPPKPVVLPSVKTIPPAPRRRWVRTRRREDSAWEQWAGAPLTLAASVLVAFALGWLARPTSAIWEDVPQSPVAPALVQKSAPESPIVSDDDELFGSLAPEPQETVTLVMNCGRDGETRQIELPVLASSDENLAALTREGPVVPAEVQAALLQIGHRVTERRELMPLVLEDGRRMVVPVDEIEFAPVAATEYQ